MHQSSHLSVLQAIPPRVERRMQSEDFNQLSESDDSQQHTTNETQDTVTTATSTKKARKRKSPSWKLRSLTFEDLQAHFDKPLHVAAQMLDISDNGLKKLCRERRIERWPYREIQGLRNTISHLETVMTKSASIQERHKVQELLTTLQGQEQFLFDTGKSKEPPQLQHTPIETASAAATLSTLRAAVSSADNASAQRKFPSVSAAVAITAAPIAPTAVPLAAKVPPLNASLVTEDSQQQHQQQQVLWTIMEQLGAIADGQRTLANRVSRLEALLTNMENHPHSQVHPLPSPVMNGAFAHTHTHTHSSGISMLSRMNMNSMSSMSDHGPYSHQLSPFYSFPTRPDALQTAAPLQQTFRGPGLQPPFV